MLPLDDNSPLMKASRNPNGFVKLQREIVIATMGNNIEAIEDVVENEVHLIPNVVRDCLCALSILTKMFVADRWWWRGGFISMISGRGGCWSTIRSMDSNDGSKGGLVVLDVSGSGVVFRVVSSSVREAVCGAKGVFGGNSKGVDGGVTLSLGGENVFRGDDSFDKVRLIKQHGLALIQAVLHWFCLKMFH
nr:hypothetical protein [Tanacetum cinerariifolium]